MLAIMYPTIETYTLLGAAVYTCQKAEFALAGIASHMSHLPEAQNDKRFRNLTPDALLNSSMRSDNSFKATFGQIYEIFGNRLLVSGLEFDQFVADRNRIVHHFWRETREIRGRIEIPDPHGYLLAFIGRAEQIVATLQGLLSHLQEAAAQKSNRMCEFTISEKDIQNRGVYEELVVRSRNKR